MCTDVIISSAAFVGTDPYFVVVSCGFEAKAAQSIYEMSVPAFRRCAQTVNRTDDDDNASLHRLAKLVARHSVYLFDGVGVNVGVENIALCAITSSSFTLMDLIVEE